MSAPRFARLAESLRGAVLAAAWAQWQAVGAMAAAPRAPAALVDPEALILASLWLQDDEPRLWDFLHGFAGLGPRLLSVQRIQSLLGAFPDDGAERLALFARAVVEQGKDPRWRRLAGRASAPKARPRKLDSPFNRLTMPASLMLRLRAGIGVDVRTDTLAYLLGRNEERVGVAEIASALDYGTSSVRAATEALAAARLIESGDSRPRRYYASRPRWGAVLGPAALAPWRPWSHAYGFALRLLIWIAEVAPRATSNELANSLARDLVDAHGAVVDELRLAGTRRAGLAGEANAPVFERLVTALAAWFREQT